MKFKLVLYIILSLSIIFFTIIVIDYYLNVLYYNIFTNTLYVNILSIISTFLLIFVYYYIFINKKYNKNITFYENLSRYRTSFNLEINQYHKFNLFYKIKINKTTLLSLSDHTDKYIISKFKLNKILDHKITNINELSEFDFLILFFYLTKTDIEKIELSNELKISINKHNRLIKINKIL